MSNGAVAVEDIEAHIRGLSSRPNRELDHLPGSYGWPILGHTVEFFRDLPALVRIN